MFRCVIDIICLQLKTISYVHMNCQCEVLYISYFLGSYECLVLDCLSVQKFLTSTYWLVQRIARHICMGQYISIYHQTIGRYRIVGRYNFIPTPVKTTYSRGQYNFIPTDDSSLQGLIPTLMVLAMRGCGIVVVGL